MMHKNLFHTYVIAALAIMATINGVAMAQSVPGEPKASDVIFSSRLPSYDALDLAPSFHVTRFDWTYIGGSDSDSRWVKAVLDAGYSVGATFSPLTIDKQKAVDEGWAAIDWKGDLVTLPRFESAQRWTGDVNDIRFQDDLFNRMQRVIDAGVTRIQWDDPALPIELLPQGGVYNDASVNKFRGYLLENSNGTQRQSWGMPSDMLNFNYRDYVADHNGTVNTTLSGLWREFENESTESFFNTLHQRINNYAGYDVPFSANNYGGNWGIEDHANSAAGRIYKLFDYGIAELPESGANPANILLRIHQARELGKAQVFTLRSRDVALNRKVIAYTYAIGSHTVVPWDVYNGDGVDRFYGTPEQFGDIYGLVRDHASLYDDYKSMAYTGPEITDERYSSVTNPVSIHASSGELYAFLRNNPDDATSPLVLHLVDWADTPTASTVDLKNVIFGADDDTTMLAQLLLPDKIDETLTGVLLGNGYTRFTLPALSPYGLLVIEPGGTVPEPATVAIMAGLACGFLMRRPGGLNRTVKKVM